MADRSRRVALAAIVLPFWLLAMSGFARAFTVTNTNDTGSGSLRAAITSANAAPTAVNNIDFTVSGTIILGSSLPPIANTSPGSLTIDGSGHSITVDGNNAVQILIVNSGATLTLNNLTIAKGSTQTTSPFAGGGILNHGTLTVTNSTLSDNFAPGAGGGIDNQGTATVTNSTFSGNNVIHEGGAIDNSGTLTVTNSTFIGNEADGEIGGGAISNGGTLRVTNSTFFENRGAEQDIKPSTIFDGIAPGTGGIFNGGSATLKGTILADETGGNCGATVTPPITDAGYNISDDDTCGFTMAPTGTSINNSTMVHLDPLGLQNNGGPTNTIALEMDSEGVDFIPIAKCTDQSSPTPQLLTSDQRGFPRPDPANLNFCDAGAYELQATPIVIEPNGERLQIVHSSTPSGNQLNTAFTFIENASPTCDAALDAFNGITVTLSTGSCADLGNNALSLSLDAFSVHTVNHQSYGTFFFGDPPFTLSVRMVELPMPSAPACGEWTMNLELTGLDLTFLGDGPFALILSNSDGDTGCLDITNAIVGNQIPTPPSHSVRRGTRRR